MLNNTAQQPRDFWAVGLQEGGRSVTVLGPYRDRMGAALGKGRLKLGAHSKVALTRAWDRLEAQRSAEQWWRVKR